MGYRAFTNDSITMIMRVFAALSRRTTPRNLPDRNLVSKYAKLGVLYESLAHPLKSVHTTML